ncbi:uncharacterized protein isoform X1 [Choristoneura fumiferana]|uniref:uncharacterized protein isoform X1 n=1 Tax=Choristoneura fumiferana TaxID=7141 RepID=UPI003D15D8CB
MFSIKKAPKASTEAKSISTYLTVDMSTEVDSTSSSDESASIKSKTFSILRSTKNCVLRQYRGRRRAQFEPGAPAPPRRHAGCGRGILRHTALSALAAKLEAVASEASEGGEGGARPRTRCLIGRVPRRGVGVALTVRRPHKQTGSGGRVRQLMRKRSC